jgi:hypothetical protein
MNPSSMAVADETVAKIGTRLMGCHPGRLGWGEEKADSSAALRNGNAKSAATRFLQR